MINLASLVFNPFQENTYIISDQTGECIIVDPGNSNERENQSIEKYIEQNKLKPVMIVNTHGHGDHILGVDFLKERYGIPFAIDRADDMVLEGSVSHGRMYGFDIETVPTVDIDLSDKKYIKFGDSEIEIIKTPGHTPGGVVLYNRENKILITGDTLFKGSIGRTDLPGGDYRALMNSIIRNVIPLGGDIAVYPGHGPSSTIGIEIESNPFITEVIEGEVNI